jgi:DNA-binding NarL/FixJ family response regulator
VTGALGPFAWDLGPYPRGPIAVFLLDDHEVVRRGVKDLLAAEPDIRVVGTRSESSIPPSPQILHRAADCAAGE